MLFSLKQEAPVSVGGGTFTGLMGHASEINAEEVREKYAPMLMRGELINQAYKIVRDMWIFTNCRLIIVNV